MYPIRNRGSLATLALLACMWGTASCTDKKAPAAGPVTIGWIGPATGYASALGVDNLNATKLVINQYNQSRAAADPEIVLAVEDDQYIGTKSFISYQNLARKNKPTAILISTYDSTKLLASQAKEDNIVMVNPIDNDAFLTRLGEPIFLVAKRTEAMASALANRLSDLKKKSVAIFYFSDDRFMPTLMEATKKELEGYKVQVWATPHTQQTLDFTGTLKDAMQRNADAYVFFGYVEIGTAMKQAREIGVTAAFYSVNVVMAKELQQNSKDALNNIEFVHFTSLDGLEQKAGEFLEKYKAAYGAPPETEWTALQARDATELVIAAIKASRPDRRYQDICAYLKQVHEFPGATGKLSFDGGTAVTGIVPAMYRLSSGKALKL